jgi:RNA polymerase sigma-70 factor (ECF subfamily)
MECDAKDLPSLLAADVRRHFPQLVTSYQRRLYTFAYRLTGSQQTAEDLTQEAFVRAYVALLTYPAARIQTLKLQAWLYKITLNEFHHHVRGARLHVVPLDLADDSSAYEIEASADERPDLVIESREQLAELEAAVAALPERYRVPVLCCYFEQLSYQDIADLLDQPLGTVKSAIFRGVRLLRTLLDERQRDKQGDEQDKNSGKEGEQWNRTMRGNRKA